MAKSMYVTRECIYCGPRIVLSNYHDDSLRNHQFIVCPTCGLDPAETRMIEDVITRGFEACYREEVQRERGKLQKEYSVESSE